MSSELLTWEDVYLHHRRRMLARAYSLTKDPDDAEDLVQDTNLRLLGSSYQPGDFREPLALVFRVMLNIFIDGLRKAKSGQTRSLDDPLNVDLQYELPITEPTVQHDMETMEAFEAMERRKGPLSPRERCLFELMKADKTCEEISHILNEDVRITRADCAALMNKLKYRLRKNKGR